MKDKLEVGMYVRTKHNGIGKIVEYINDPTNYFFKCYKLDRNCFNCEEYITESDVIGEPSHNPIDLIKEGDYVNGVEVISVDDEWITMNDIQVPILKSIANGLIKSILTKQQFESMSYKLED